jgi:hypothetical protein
MVSAMATTIPADLDALWGSDRTRQNEAYTAIMAATEQPVDWADAVWEQAVGNLAHKDNHNRAIAAQLLCNLAKSDPEGRILQDFDKLLAVTKDERFVTARHCLQNLWKVGVAGAAQRARLLEGLEMRYFECMAEKNWSLIRFDIIQGLRHLYDAVLDEAVKAQALALIGCQDDTKYRKKYAGVWKSAK